MTFGCSARRAARPESGCGDERAIRPRHRRLDPRIGRCVRRSSAGRSSPNGLDSKDFRSPSRRWSPTGTRSARHCASAVDDGVDVIITSGGTGISPTDSTPDQTVAVLDYMIPGLADAIRRSGPAEGADVGAVARGVRRGRPDPDRQPAGFARRGTRRPGGACRRARPRARSARRRRSPAMTLVAARRHDRPADLPGRA